MVNSKIIDVRVILLCLIVGLAFMIIGGFIWEIGKDMRRRAVNETPKQKICILDYIDTTQPIEYVYSKVSVIRENRSGLWYEDDVPQPAEQIKKLERRVIFYPDTEAYLGLIDILWKGQFAKYVIGRDGDVMREGGPIPHIGPSVSILRQRHDDNSLTEIIVIRDGWLLILKLPTGEVIHCNSDTDLFHILMLARPK